MRFLTARWVELRRGKYKLTLKYEGELKSIKYFDEDPTLLKQRECVNIRILKKGNGFFSLALNITKDIDEFWIQFESSEGYKSHYELCFGKFSRYELAKIEWTWRAIIRHVIKRALGIRKASETSRILGTYSLKPREFNQLLTPGQPKLNKALE